jgi:excisionase family DNA binding protein
MYDYLTPTEAATYLRVSPKTLARWRWAGNGPRYVKPTRRIIRYARADLDAWLQAQGRAHTSERPPVVVPLRRTGDGTHGR